MKVHYRISKNQGLGKPAGLLREACGQNAGGREHMAFS